MELTPEMVSILVRDFAFREALATKLAHYLADKMDMTILMSLVANRIADQMEPSLRRGAVGLIEPTVRQLLSKEIGEAAAMIGKRLAEFAVTGEARDERDSHAKH